MTIKTRYLALGILAIAIAICSAVALAWWNSASNRLAEIRQNGIFKVVVRVGAPLKSVKLYELRNADANTIADLALRYAKHTGLVGAARADFIDLYLFDDENSSAVRIRLTSSDDATSWQSRDELIAIAQSGQQYSDNERDLFFSELPSDLEEHILVVR
jgi:hypothetical protein